LLNIINKPKIADENGFITKKMEIDEDIEEFGKNVSIDECINVIFLFSRK